MRSTSPIAAQDAFSRGRRGRSSRRIPATHDNRIGIGLIPVILIVTVTVMDSRSSQETSTTPLVQVRRRRHRGAYASVVTVALLLCCSLSYWRGRAH
jgi:hypothetical protein